MNRWEAFSMRERATIAVCLTAGLLKLTEEDIPNSDRARLALEVVALVDEIGADMDSGDPVDPKIVAELRKVASEPTENELRERI